MIFTPTPIAGAFVIDIEPRRDARGFFARAWCAEEFAKHGLITHFAQINIGSNHTQGTVRGIHVQRPPHVEVKIVGCTKGAIFDVVVDLRPESPTHRQWFGAELSGDNRRMLVIPERCGHGYQTLTAEADMYYMASTPFAPASAVGVRFNDAAFGILWPLPVALISDADRAWPDYGTGAHLGL